MPVTTIQSLLDYAHPDKVEPMTKEQAHLFALALWSEDKPVPPEAKEVLKRLISFQILSQRLKAFSPTTQYTEACAVFVASMCTTPGKAVLWAYTFHKMARLHNRPVDTDLLANCFPVGFPTEQSQRECWDAQKGTGDDRVDNWLDHKEAWE